MTNARAGRLFPPLAVVALVSLALVPLGSYTFLAHSVLQFSLAALFLVSIARYAVTHDVGSTASTLFDGTLPTAVLALPLLAIIQTSLQFAIGFSTGPTLAMTEAAMTTIVIAAFYLLCHCAASTRSDIRKLAFGLVIVGTLEALYGVLNLLSGNEYLLIYKRITFHDSATGTLVTRAHFAYLMEMLAPLGIAILAAEAQKARLYRDSDSSGRVVAAGVASVAMLLALIFSRSRMGIASLAGATAIVLTANRLLKPATLDDVDAPDPRRRLALTTTLVAFAAFALLIGVDAVFARFLDLEHDFQAGRLQAWKATAAMFLDRPIFGHGWGTFRELIVGYQQRPTGYFFVHAHNEYLQVLAEAGVIGLSVVAYLVFLFVRRLTNVLALQLDTQQRTIVTGLSIAITSVLLHSIADFGLRIPGVALTFVAVLALFVRISADPRLVAEEAPVSTGQRRRRRRRYHR